MCKQNSCNSITASIISVILGISLSVLFSLSLIPNVIFSLWIALGLSILSLVVLFFIIPLADFNNFSSLKKCTCVFGKSLIIGTLGTLVSTIAALSLAIVINTPLIIIFFLIGFFFSFLLISIIQFLWCIITNNCCNKFFNCEN